MKPTPMFHSFLQRITAYLLVVVILCWILTPAALAAATTSKARKPICRAGSTAKQKKKRVRITVSVRKHGKVKRRRVWVTKKKWVCVKDATSPAAASDKQAPSAPTGLQAGPGNSQVTLVWNVASDNVGVTGYRVYRDGALVASPATASFKDTGLTNGQSYAYGVAAVDAAGNVSATATIAATPKSSADASAPSAPPSFGAVAGDRQVALSWGAATDDVGVVFYELRRDGVSIAFQETRTFTDLALTNGQAYSYTVIAYDAAGNASAAAAATATPADTVAPATPAGLTATPSSGQVSLTWTAATDNVGVTGYRVYRDGALIASPVTAYYADTGLVNDTTHSYTVVAVDGSGNASAPSAPVNATPSAPAAGDTQAPTVPGGLAGAPATGKVTLTWNASTDNVGVTGYKVYRGGVLIGTPAGPSFVDTVGLVNGTAYSYTVAAVDASGNASAPSAAIQVTPHDTQAPTVPTGITLTKNAANHSITVAWLASTDDVGVLKYRVYRNGTLVGQPTSLSYADIDLSNGKTYSYTVSAVDAAGNASAQAPVVSTYVS